MKESRSAGWRTFVPAVLVGVVVAGCSGDAGRVPVYPVQGKVTVGGEVPEGALVVFYPAAGAATKDIRPSAKVDKDGAFRLTTYDADDGAPAGDYTATIQWNKLVKQGGDYKAGPNLVPGDYGSPEKSTWKVKVSNGRNDVPPVDIKK